MKKLPDIRLWISLVLVSIFIMLPVYPLQANNSIPSYEKGLNKFLEKKKQAASKKPMFNKSEREIMEKAGLVVANKLKKPGLKVDTKAPDFNLPNAKGKKVSLSTYLKKGPVILVFYRGAWCPFCNLQLHTYIKSIPHFKKYKANIIAITPQKPDKSLKQIEKNKIPFEVLSDLDSRVMKDYNLFFEVPAELVKLYKSKGLDLDDFNGKGRHVLPAPGVFIIDQEGIIRAMEASTDYKTRMEPAAIVKALKRL